MQIWEINPTNFGTISTLERYLENTGIDTTYREIADKLDLSTERTRQILEKAIRKLRGAIYRNIDHQVALTLPN